MSGHRKTRRRFFADLLFAGGAVTAASVMGYVATHRPTLPPEVVTTPTPVELHPEGAKRMDVPLTPCPPDPFVPPPNEVHPGGKPVCR